MKKILFLLLFSVIFSFVLFIFTTNITEAALTPDPTVCNGTYTDAGGETRSAEGWCTNWWSAQYYDFCVGNRHYGFGCDGFAGFSCDENNAGYEDCLGGCTNWDCEQRIGCTGGACLAAQPCADIGEGCRPGPPEFRDCCDPYICSSGVCVGAGNGVNGGVGNGIGGFTGRLEPPINATSFEALVGGIINFIFWIAIALAPIMILIAGFLFITAGGNPQQIERAKRLILYTVIGLVVILLAKGLIGVLESVLGVKGE